MWFLFYSACADASQLYSFHYNALSLWYINFCQKLWTDGPIISSLQNLDNLVSFNVADTWDESLRFDSLSRSSLHRSGWLSTQNATWYIIGCWHTEGWHKHDKSQTVTRLCASKRSLLLWGLTAIGLSTLSSWHRTWKHDLRLTFQFAAIWPLLSTVMAIVAFKTFTPASQTFSMSWTLCDTRLLGWFLTKCSTASVIHTITPAWQGS